MTQFLISKSISTIKLISILTLIALQTQLARGQAFSCAENVKGFRFNLDKISGIWYEAARVPPSDVPACVSVTVPNTIENETFHLHLDYINNVNKKWEPTTEDLIFPWTELSQNGIFELEYGSGSASITFIFKLVITDYNNLAVVCYYTNLAPSVTMLKVMTRQQQVNSTYLDEIQKMAEKYGVGNQITWVEQSSKCNGGTITRPGKFLMLLVVLTLVFKVINLNKEK